jgi:hypothetical protein
MMKKASTATAAFNSLNGVPGRCQTATDNASVNRIAPFGDVSSGRSAGQSMVVDVSRTLPARARSDEIKSPLQRHPRFSVMPALVAGIHVLPLPNRHPRAGERVAIKT